MKKTGVLMPVFSLPGDYGIGDFGKYSYEFVDALKEAGVAIWQVLPLNPISYGHSPYQPLSSKAGETAFIDLETLYEEDLLDELPEPFRPDAEKVDYEAVAAFKEPYFREAFANFIPDKDYIKFVSQEWVFFYGAYRALKKKNGGKCWIEWPEEDKNWINTMADLPEWGSEIQYECFLQYEFYSQWTALKDYANEIGIKIMGDIPFYVGLDSVDAWANRESFLMDPDGNPTYIAGVAPDYFSETGQRWGNPIYDWDYLSEHWFAFLTDRIKYTSNLYDMIRIDHFRAFDTYWKIPAECPTAIEGEWIEAPGYEFFDVLLPMIPNTEIVAEDLGLMRPEVYELRDHYKFPGMNVVQFTMLDENFKMSENMITYTGTHDNNTVTGWYVSLSEEDQKRVDDILDEAKIPEGEPHERLVRFALGLKTETCIVPVQDLLGLPEEARINVPAIVNDVNWTFKMKDFTGLSKGLELLKA